MRKTRWIAAVLLAVMLLTLCGCKSQEQIEEEVHNALRGSWRASIGCSRQTTQDLLDNIDLYDQERELLDFGGPQLVKIAHFADGTYRFEVDTDAVWDNVRAFYDKVFSVLYENRTKLNTLYNKTFDDMAEADFKTFYAELYGHADYETMLSALTDAAFDYEAMNVVETGTYTVEDEDMIYCEPNESHASAGTLRVSVRGDGLNIAFAGGDEAYTRIP